jgi:WD40 repeat protein
MFCIPIPRHRPHELYIHLVCKHRCPQCSPSLSAIKQRTHISRSHISGIMSSRKFQQIRLLSGHASRVQSIAFSPNGRFIASGSRDKTIWVLDVATGQIASGPLKGHTDWVTSIAISPDSKHIVSGSCDMTIRVWEADTGKVVLGPLKEHAAVIVSVAFSPNGV